MRLGSEPHLKIHFAHSSINPFIKCNLLERLKFQKEKFKSSERWPRSHLKEIGISIFRFFNSRIFLDLVQPLKYEMTIGICRYWAKKKIELVNQTNYASNVHFKNNVTECRIIFWLLLLQSCHIQFAFEQMKR